LNWREIEASCDVFSLIFPLTLQTSTGSTGDPGRHAFPKAWSASTRCTSYLRSERDEGVLFPCQPCRGRKWLRKHSRGKQSDSSNHFLFGHKD
jgi:hypothetical protein